MRSLDKQCHRERPRETAERGATEALVKSRWADGSTSTLSGFSLRAVAFYLDFFDKHDHRRPARAAARSPSPRAPPLSGRRT